MPKDDNQTTNTTPTTDASGFAPLISEDTLPPMMSSPSIDNYTKKTDSSSVPAPTLTTNDNVEVKNIEADPTSVLDTNSSSSAAPLNDVIGSTVMETITSTPKKKFGGGKVIATILGLFIIVGGVGAGVFLSQQNQDVREKAANSVCDTGTAAQKAAAGCGKSCPSGSYSCTRGCCAVSSGQTIPDGSSGGGTCGAGQHLCSCSAGGGCVSNSMSCTTYCGSSTNVVSDSTNPANPNGNNTTGGNTTDTDPNHSINTTCGSTWSSTDTCQGVQEVTSYPTLSQGQEARCQNGRCQVYDANGNRVGGEYRLVGSGGGGDTPTPPAITAKCQNIAAYSETWTALTKANLSALKAGDKVNFCVAGSATGGSFTKAKLTINSVAQAETSTKRPSSDDFCQLYTIPAATNTFNVTAQINHSTLGWK